MESLKINIRYKNEEVPKLTKICKGNGIDVYIDNLVSIRKRHGEDKECYERSKMFEENGDTLIHAGETATFGLGFACHIPEGYYAELIPRSSTYGKKKIILVNGTGLIDSSYNGNNDEWMVQVLAVEDTFIDRFDRLFQFTIKKEQPVEFIEVEDLGNQDRGGFGSTGGGVLNE